MQRLIQRLLSVLLLFLLLSGGIMAVEYIKSHTSLVSQEQAGDDDHRGSGRKDLIQTFIQPQQ